MLQEQGSKKLSFTHIKPRLYISLILLLIFVVIFSLFLTRNLTDLEEQSEIIVNREVALLLEVEKLNFSVVQVQQWLTDISATRGLDGLNDGFDEAKKHADIARSSLENIAKLDEKKADYYHTILIRFNDFYEVGKIMAQQYVANGPQAGNQLMGKFDTASASLQEELSPLVDETHSNLSSLLAAQSKSVTTIKHSVLATAGVIFCFCCGVFWIVNRLFLRLNLIHQNMVNISNGEAGFNSRIEIDKQDELAEIAQAFNLFIQKLSATVTQVINISEELSSTSRRVQQQTISTCDAIEVKTHEVSALADTAAVMAQQAKSVKDHIDETSESINKVNERSQSGSRLITDVISQMKTLTTDTNDLNNVVNELNEQCNSIGKVVSMIAGVAAQTNLLALNAAIEAARAGEHGRGFAVVADEVRSLSARTTQATLDIQALIDVIQISSDEAVVKVEKSTTLATQTLEKSQAAIDAFLMISESVDSMSGHAEKIVNLATQQYTSSDEINKAIVKIKTEFEYLSSQTKQSVSENGDLSQYSMILKATMANLSGRENDKAKDSLVDLF